MLSDREFQVLRRRPGQMLCCTCISRLASVLLESESIHVDSEENVWYSKGICECGQPSTIARFVPPEEPEEPKKDAATV
jgi:hypothetical protein